MRWDSRGIFWEDKLFVRAGGPRVLGPMPAIPETGWKVPTSLPNIQHAKWLSIDTETYDPGLNDYGPGWSRGLGHICGISVAAEGQSWYFPMRHEVEKELNMDPDMVLRWAQWAFSGNGVKIGANLQYDIGWLEQEGVKVAGQLYDVQLAESLINETSKLALDSLGWKYMGEGKDDTLLKEWARSYYTSSEQRWRKDIYRCPVSLVGPYAEQDARLPYDIMLKQWPILNNTGVMDLFHMECKLIRLLVAMRFKGVAVDLKYAEKLYDDFGVRSSLLQEKVNSVAGFEVNPNAGESMARAFNELGLKFSNTAPTATNPEGKPSFTADFLKTIDHPFAKGVLQLKQLEKIRGTFLKSYILDSSIPIAGHPGFGKLHCTFHQTSNEAGGTRTGRLSSSDPNLQNIPTRTEEGRLIRKAFVMDPGHLQVRDYDYQQIEYKMLAHYATGPGSQELRDRYNNDPKLDYHKLIGSMIAKLPGLEHYALPQMRGAVKNVNFGVVYGVGDNHMAELLGLGIKEARALLAKIHEAVPFAKATMDELSKEVNRSGIVTTILGRRSHFDLWEPSEWGRKSKMGPLPYKLALEAYGVNIERAYLYRALNYRLQGSAAEIMKAAMVRCHKEGVFDVTGVPRLTVHDELFFSEPHGVSDDAWAHMKHIMETALPGVKVPIRADFGVGANWRDAH